MALSPFTGRAQASEGATAPTPGVAAQPAPATSPQAAPDTPDLLRLPPLVGPPLQLTAVDALWSGWRKASDGAALEAAQSALLELRRILAVDELEPLAMAFARTSDEKREAGDPGASVQMAQAAIEFAPSLPQAHWTLARAFLSADPTQPGRVLAAAHEGASRFLARPRYRRALAADLGSAALFALIGTAVATLVALFLRSARSLFHDVHHFFPSAAARWQSALFTLLVLALPGVFRLGVVPWLLVLFASVVTYLSFRERLVAGALLIALGLSPSLAGALASRTTYARTLAEDVERVEQAGFEAEASAARLRKRIESGRVEPATLFVLGRYDLRRGRFEQALESLQRAATLRQEDPLILTNLGATRLALGDAEGASDLFRRAMRVGPLLAAPRYNLYQVHRRRAALLTGEAATAELDKGKVQLGQAEALDPSLSRRPLPPEGNLELNRWMVLPGLPEAELAAVAAAPGRGDGVKAQLSIALLGRVDVGLAPYYPPLAVLLLLALGRMRPRLFEARTCGKCGRPVCRRCDPEVGMTSKLCGQCINVYARKDLVEASQRVRKHAEVTRFVARRERLSYLLGLVCSGWGHSFLGFPLRGALYGFVGLFAAFGILFRDGLVRPPYGGAPVAFRVAVLAALFVTVYLVSLVGLRRRQAEL
jgi:tetratricopeptide (TPR) repeat protein